MPAILPAVAHTRLDLREKIGAARRSQRRIGLVPTMGALHAGHISLVQAARQEMEYVVATIFVNPTQFAPHEDFNRYPQNLQADLALLAGEGADLVFAPSQEEMYRDGHATAVELAGPALPLEGELRPGHFRGVATVVLKLFHLVTPSVAFFGQKDFQQAVVIRRMAEDLDLHVAIRVCPTVREADGLALSSRNVYLSVDERRRATSLSRSLRLAESLVVGGARAGAAILQQVRAVLADADAEVDYAALVDPQTMLPVVELSGETLLAIAARIGATRLIDNTLLTPPAS